MDSGISAYTSVARVLIKTIPAVMGMYEFRSDPTGIDTGMTCALAFWPGWNSIPVQCRGPRVHTGMIESIPVRPLKYSTGIDEYETPEADASKRKTS